MAKTYISHHKHFKEEDPETLKRLFYKKSDTFIMRSLILNEKDFLSVDYERSLRGLWYNAIKPVLSKLDLLEKKTAATLNGPGGNFVKWDSNLSAGVAELLRYGVLTYKDLLVVDASRAKENPYSSYVNVKRETYGYQVTSEPYSNILLTAEKDTVYTIIQDMAQIFGCSCLSGKGHNSFAAMEYLIRGMGDRLKDDIIILSISDYDPSGYSIAETFKNQAEDILKALNINSVSVYAERVGIEPWQLTDEEIEQNKYTPKKDGLKKWFKKTGGINGEPYGLELDAFSPDQLRAIFLSSLKKYINEEIVTDFIKGAYIRGQVQKALVAKMESIMSEIEAAELENIKRIDFDIFDFAQDGMSYIPVMELFKNDRDQAIKEKALAYFK